jgi:hypothetical protein
VTDRAQKLLDEALALPAEDREKIGKVLLDSIDDDAQRETITRRIEEIERGEAEVHDAMDVYHRLRAGRRD